MTTPMSSRDRLLTAFAGEPLDRPPMWLMRQAGRYLPDYRAVRASNGFWDVCRTPALATRVALEPLRLFPLDAAIVFSDILTIPDALGLDVTFGTGDGPRVGRPLKTAADLEQWDLAGAAAKLSFAVEAVADLRRAIGPDVGLLGFCGSPWTLLCYAAEGQGSDDFRVARTLLATEPQLARRAMEAFADTAAGLLRAQLAAGADVVQIFDTWGGLLPREQYRAHVVPMIRRIVEQLPSSASAGRTLLFVRGGHHLLPILGDTGVSGLSLDWRTPWREARALHPRLVLQGNVDPVSLLAGPAEAARQARALLADMRADDGGRRCIANLGHGILPPTTIEAVSALCRVVADTRWQA